MKRQFLIITLITTSLLAQQVLAIGISPARNTFDLLEYNCTFGRNIGYMLIRPSSARYSMFSVYDAAGMNGTVTACSATNSFEYIDDKNILIDWQSSELASSSSITATINLQSPQLWDCPAEPGGNVYMTDLVRHSDVIESESGISAGVATVSQIALYRNYAPRANLLNYPETVMAGQSANFVFQFEDKMASWWSKYSDRDYYGRPFFSYTIDWDSDGITDFNGSAIFDEESVYDSQYRIYRWTSGIQTGTVSLDHIFDVAGNYTATVTVSDSEELTSLEIPIHVVPEPATILFFGLGGLIFRRK